MTDAPKRRKVTTRTLAKKVKDGEQIVQMAIYDYRSAVLADRLDIDILCVSDTGGMILFGLKGLLVAILFVLIPAVLIMLSKKIPGEWDLTAENEFTLHAGSYQILNKLNSGTRLTLYVL